MRSWVVVALALALGAVAVDPDVNLVRDRLVAGYLEYCDGTCAGALAYTASLQPNGSWADIDYHNESPANWQPDTHWERLATMAQGYSCPACAHGALGNASVLAAWHRAVGFWKTYDFQCPNWWFNDLGVGFSLEVAYLLLQPFLTPDELQYGCLVLSRANWPVGGPIWVGANLYNALQLQVSRGILQNDSALVAQAFSVFWSNLTVSTDPTANIQPDMSFHQHGALLQTGAYGAVSLSAALSFIQLGAGTAFAAPTANLDVLVDFILDGNWPALRVGVPSSSATSVGVFWDIPPVGRAFTRPLSGSLGFGAGSIIATLPNMTAATRYAELLSFVGTMEGTLPNLHRTVHYWTSDYTAHSRAGYRLTVKTVSKRTLNAECVNGEGLQSWHLAAGVVTAVQRGDEYEGISPAWNWTLVPGTSVRQNVHELPCLGVEATGSTTFVGGTTDGDVGVVVFDERSVDHLGTGEGTPLTAHKTWCLVDEGVVTLVWNLTLPAAPGVATQPEVWTTLDQRLIPNNVTDPTRGVWVQLVNETGPSGPLASANHSFGAGSLSWISQDGVVYAAVDGPVGLGFGTLGTPALRGDGATMSSFPLPSLVVNGPQTGTWQSINEEDSPDPVTRNVFRAHLLHGAVPANQAFAYAVLPLGEGAPTAAPLVSDFRTRFSVLRNDGLVQAAQYSNGSDAWLFASLWTANAGAVKTVGSAGGVPSLVSNSDPAAIVLHTTAGNPTTVAFTAANPENAPLTLTLVVTGSLHTSRPRTHVAGQAVSGGVFRGEEVGDAGVVCVAGGSGTTTVTITLPSGLLAGASVTGECEG